MPDVWMLWTLRAPVQQVNSRAEHHLILLDPYPRPRSSSSDKHEATSEVVSKSFLRLVAFGIWLEVYRALSDIKGLLGVLAGFKTSFDRGVALSR